MVKINASLSKEKRILKAAEQVFSHKGYTQATLDEIIQIADTGKGTVYKYYKNKENLFYTLVEAKNRKLMKAMETGGRETGIALSRELVQALRDIHADGAHLMPVNDVDAVAEICRTDK